MLTPHLDRVGGTEAQCALLARAAAQRGLVTRVLTERVPGAPLRPTGVPTLRVSHATRELARALRGARDLATRRHAGEPSSRPARALDAPLTTSGGAGPRATRARGPAGLLEARFEAWLAELVTELAAEHSVLHLHGTFWHSMLRAAAVASRRSKRPLVVKLANDPARVLASLAREPSALEALCSADAWIALGDEAARALEAFGGGPRVVRVPNAVALPTPSLEPRGRDLLFVGTLKHQKGVDVLLEAFASLGAARQGRRLRVVGDGALRGELEQRARALGLEGAVEWLGSRTNLSAFYNSCALFVLPSRFEGMPNALLEAMAHGAPSLATRVAGTTDVVGPDEAAWLVAPDDARALAEGLGRALASSEERAARGERGRARVASTFSIDAVLDQTLSLYDELSRSR
jgi:glycosyltransferase involved in cell wall biosynthesis